jgi:glycosyltransferase involved in cell wall biosynthesis
MGVSAPVNTGAHTPNVEKVHALLEQLDESGVELSVVIPVHNEEGDLLELERRLEDSLQDLEYELIFIDDGSGDASFTVLRRLRERNHRIKVIRFRRNFGKTAALSAGFAMARGRFVATMDADLQDDPAELPLLLAALDEGKDLVSGWRVERHDPVAKTLPSALFNAVVARCSGVRIHDINCGLKVYRRELVQELRLYGDLHRFTPILAHWRGFRVGEVPVRHQPRVHGRSNYGVRRLLHGFIDLAQVLFLVRYMRNPLRLFGVPGLLLSLIGFCIGLYLTALRLGGASIGRRPLLILCVLLVVAGVQLISTGLIGEMLRHTVYKTEDEYSIEQILR